MLRKIINYRKVWKALGKPYIKATGSWERLEEYGLQAVFDLFCNQFAVLEGDKPVAYFTCIFDGMFFEKDFVVLSMGKKVYVKKKGERAYEIEALDGYHYDNYCNQNNSMDGALLFYNNNYNPDKYKLLSLKTMKVFQLDGIDPVVSKSLGYIQTYNYNTDSCNVYFVNDGEICKSNITFLNYITEEEGYQINYDRNAQEWKMFYVSKNKIETIETYERCSTVPVWNVADYTVKKKDSPTELIRIDGREIKRFPILGDDFEELSCDGLMFYKSRGPKKVYLYRYNRDKLELLGEYEGSNICFGNPCFDKDEAAYKRGLIVK